MNPLYSSHPMALLTDLYEITMAYGYWKRGMHDTRAVFHLFFRKKPFNGGFTVAAGLQNVIDYLQNYRFEPSDIAYLKTLNLFEEDFLRYLLDLRLDIDIDAVKEGEIVFPYEPLIRVEGPLIHCQLLESALLTLTNFQTLIATKAARITLAAKEDPVIEFGLRRAQGIDGAMSASRAAFIGGCSSTSNLLAGKLYGIPVRGTHSHSWIMAFENELISFEAYAEALPDSCVFLVDTYDTLQGVKNAIVIGKKLRQKGRKLLGLRLDSGDLAYLSIEARKLLDESGFKETLIIASNELEETLIKDLKSQGAQIGVWGVGTHLVTGHTQPALDGVYKLSAIKNVEDANWKYKIKLSENMSKVSNPGILQIRRYFDEDLGYVGDAIFDRATDLKNGALMIDPFDQTREKRFSGKMPFKDLLEPIFRNGNLVYTPPSLIDIQSYAKQQLAFFDQSIKRIFNPHLYPVGLEKSLYDLKIQLVANIRKQLKGEM